MSEAQARAQPRIDHPDELERIVRQIVERVEPVAIYLFGSRARGEGHEDSDYDLMVVVPDAAMDRTMRDRLWQARRAIGIGAELIPTRESAFAWRRHELGTLEYEVEADGLQLYPRHRRPFRPRRPSGPPTMNVLVVDEWLRRVNKDLIVARKACEGEDAVPDQAAYHVQQAAEKLVKGALVAHLVRPRKGHKIEEFAPLLPPDFSLRDRFVVLEQFSKYAWAHRYPLYPGQEEVPEPSTAEVAAWISQVAELKADFERWLQDRAGGR